MTAAIIILSILLVLAANFILIGWGVADKYKKLYEQSCKEYQDLIRANKHLLKVMEGERSSIDDRINQEVKDSVRNALKNRSN